MFGRNCGEALAISVTRELGRGQRLEWYGPCGSAMVMQDTCDATTRWARLRRAVTPVHCAAPLRRRRSRSWASVCLSLELLSEILMA